MNTIKTVRPIHPLMAIAAVSVIALSGFGIAAINGWLPSSHGTAAPNDATINAPASSVANGPGTAGTPASNFPPPNASPPSSLPAANGVPPSTVDGQVVGAPCHACGRVEAIRTVEQQAKPSGVGAVAGALLGGVIGNRFGGGNGRVLTTVGGAVGGGFAGNEIEKRTHTTTSYLVEVRMENGKLRTFHSATPPGWQIGDPVQIVQGKLAPRG
ncbi:MAG TPA: glycine zipper 2TM domain-containing protein [Burkholderiaceae bacterium]|jgi:outer membrane lipoprotein SlyB|nr:glycine zipper 2TM domain-containing protein [Burkholderiaceae bacterium]